MVQHLVEVAARPRHLIVHPQVLEPPVLTPATQHKATRTPSMKKIARMHTHSLGPHDLPVGQGGGGVGVVVQWRGSLRVDPKVATPRHQTPHHKQHT
jgi:hypothetical protein